jgi:hypothetical protein
MTNFVKKKGNEPSARAIRYRYCTATDMLFIFGIVSRIVKKAINNNNQLLAASLSSCVQDVGRGRRHTLYCLQR